MKKRYTHLMLVTLDNLRQAIPYKHYTPPAAYHNLLPSGGHRHYVRSGWAWRNKVKIPCYKEVV